MKIETKSRRLATDYMSKKNKNKNKNEKINKNNIDKKGKGIESNE